MEFHRHTIAAIATPTGRGGIGIIKISGQDAIRVLEKVFIPGKKTSGTFRFDRKCKDYPFRSLHYGRICHPETGDEIDEVLISLMRAPRSYTGEDVVEINAHGGPQVLAEILELILSNGIQEAKPGEFTFRAFLNGKIDLTKAEAICDLINAKSQMASKVAARQLQGEIQHQVNTIRDAILTMLADLEARIEFQDDVEPDDLPAMDMETVKTQMIRPIQTLIARHDQFRSVIQGATVVIAGKSNVGKSSLLNALSCTERAIVTQIPGTTRDTIEVEMEIEGVPITLIDTAGLQETQDPVEAIGIERARKKIETSDLILWVIDISKPLEDEDLKGYEATKGKRCVLVGNKADLLTDPEPNRKICIEGKYPVRVSARYHKGMEALKIKIREILIGEASSSIPGLGAVPNRRHRRALNISCEYLKKVQEGLRRSIPSELISYDLKAAKDALEEITGANLPEAVYDKIFSQFCVGK